MERSRSSEPHQPEEKKLSQRNHDKDQSDTQNSGFNSRSPPAAGIQPLQCKEMIEEDDQQRKITQPRFVADPLGDMCSDDLVKQSEYEERSQ